MCEFGVYFLNCTGYKLYVYYLVFYAPLKLTTVLVDLDYIEKKTF